MTEEKKMSSEEKKKKLKKGLNMCAIEMGVEKAARIKAGLKQADLMNEERRDNSLS